MPKRSAVQHLVRTFFRGSRAGAVAALLELPGKELSEDDLERLRATYNFTRRTALRLVVQNVRTRRDATLYVEPTIAVEGSLTSSIERLEGSCL